ncbi:hypothetical protein Btru_066654 [Bulinus truncatus]|nr:hypothetical protein Btru_066654 [Bulinus truncatus]
MATLSNEDKCIFFKDRLNYLGCPYTEEMDETDIHSLLTNPGEIRFKILHWLFSRYDSELADFLELSTQTLGAKSETRIRRLLNAGNALCLCSSNDSELIKGNAPVDRQITFVDRLVDLVFLREKSFSLEDTLSYRPVMSLSHLDTLVTQDGFLQMFDGLPELLPRDISMEIDNMSLKSGKKEKSLPIPTLQDLLDLGEKLSIDIQDSHQQLKILQKEVSVQDESKGQEVVLMSHMLSTVLKELRQLSEGFTQCYKSNISQWCNQPPPQLSQLGLTIKQVHGSLQSLSPLLSHMNEIRQTQTRLNKMVKKEFTGCSVIKDEASKELSESFQQCLNILEETLHRCDSRFVSKHPASLSV